MASTASGEGPSGFSLEASLATLFKTVGAAHLVDGAAWLVRPQRFDIWTEPEALAIQLSFTIVIPMASPGGSG